MSPPGCFPTKDGNSLPTPLCRMTVAECRSARGYNYFRDYDPQLGRYVQSDPIGLEGGLNTYLYANANPLRFIDLFGLDGLVADHGALRHFNDAGEGVGYYRYTTSREGVTDPSVSWKGPIPPG